MTSRVTGCVGLGQKEVGQRQPQQDPGVKKLAQSMLAVSRPSVWGQAMTTRPFSFAQVVAWALGTLAMSKNGIWWSGLRMSRLFPATVLAGWETEGPDGVGWRQDLWDEELKAQAPLPSSARTPLSVLRVKKSLRRSKLCTDAVQSPEKSRY